MKNKGEDGAKGVEMVKQEVLLENELLKTDKLLDDTKNKLSKAIEEYNSAGKQISDANLKLSKLQLTPEGRTLSSPEKHPIKSSTNHKIYVKDPIFSGEMDITAEAVINNKANLDYLLNHNGLEYKRNILGDKNPVVTKDVEGDKAIYKAEYEEYDKLRQRLLNAKKNISDVENEINKLKNTQQQKASEQKKINNNLDSIRKEKANIENKLSMLNKELSILESEKNKAEEIKTSIAFTADFFKVVTDSYGEKAGELAKNLAKQAKSKNIRNIDDALAMYEKHKENINKKINAKDRKAIAAALESVKVADIAKNLKQFSKGMGYAGLAINATDWFNELIKAVRTDNWRPFFVKTETIAVGIASTAVVGFAFSLLLGGPVGVLGYALIIAGVGALIDDELIEKANKLIVI